MLWGSPLSTWELVVKTALWVAGITGAVAAVSAFIAGYVGYELTDVVQKEAERQISETRSEAERANESSEKLKNDTARLTAENLALQKAMLPRRLAVIRMDQPFGEIDPWTINSGEAAGLFSEIQKFRCPIWMQVVPEFEPETFARDLKAALEQNGIRVTIVDQSVTNNPATEIPHGVRVMVTTKKLLESKPDPTAMGAAGVLARVLSEGGFGVGAYSVAATIIEDRPTGGKLPYFDPPFNGVLVQIGRKPLTRELFMFARTPPAPKAPALNATPK